MHDRDHLVRLVLQGEMSGIKKMKLGFGQVAEEGACAFRQEDGIIFAPQDQGRRLMGAEIGVEVGVEPDIGPIVVDDVQLDVRAARAVEEELIV